MEQFDGAGDIDHEKAVDHQQHVYRPGVDHRLHHSRTGYPDLQWQVDVHQPPDEQVHPLVQDHAQANARHEACSPADEQLHKQDHGDVLLRQAQDIEEAEFPLALFHQEAVGVKQENHREEHNDQFPEPEHHLHLGPAEGLGHHRAVFQADDQIQHQGAECGCQHKRDRGLFVAAQVRKGEFCGEPHARSPFRDIMVSVRLMSS